MPLTQERVCQHREQAVECRGVQTVGKPVDAEELEEGRLHQDRDDSRRSEEIAQWHLPTEHAPGAVIDDGLVDRHEAVATIVEADQRPEQEQRR